MFINPFKVFLLFTYILNTMLITDKFNFQVALLVLQCCELTISMAIFICKQYLQD